MKILTSGELFYGDQGPSTMLRAADNTRERDVKSAARHTTMYCVHAASMVNAEPHIVYKKISNSLNACTSTKNGWYKRETNVTLLSICILAFVLVTCFYHVTCSCAWLRVRHRDVKERKRERERDNIVKHESKMSKICII